MTRQPSLFAAPSPRPDGLVYRDDFLDPDEEHDLLGRVAALPFEPFQFGIYEGKRRVAYFGTRYDFTHQRLAPAADLPVWILPYVERVERVGEIARGSIRHALFTEYDVGAGIGWHRDKKQFDEVFGISLLSACTIRFRRRRDASWERFALPCRARSLYVLSGEARASWEHSIAPVAEKRYSITFRTMVDGGSASRSE